MKTTIKKAARKPTLGARLIEGLTEVRDALAAGRPLEERFTVRTYRLPDPGEYDAAAVAKTRKRLNASQAIFAKLLGASPALVRAWEIGNRRPSRMARRLLDEFNREPKRWAGLIIPAGKRDARRAG
jgi:DNA-binding transcriptional regulator YiaG